VHSYLTAREQKLCRRRAKVEKLLAWKQKLDEEEREIERLEKEAVHDVASRRASAVNDSIMSGEADARHTTYYCYYTCRDHSNTCWTSSLEQSANPAARVGHYTRTISTSTQNASIWSH